MKTIEKKCRQSPEGQGDKGDSEDKEKYEEGVGEEDDDNEAVGGDR